MKTTSPNGDITADEIATLYRRIAPADFASHPIYVCFASTMPADLAPSEAINGFTARQLDLSFRPWLTTEGRWRGRGAVVVLNDKHIAEGAHRDAGDDLPLVGEVYRGRLLATALHELAHVLSDPIDYRPVPPEIADDIEQQARRTVSEWVAKNGHIGLSLAPWEGHGLAFIRTLLHIVSRSQSLGIERLPDNWLYANLMYGIRSPLFVYRRAAEQELEAFDSTCTFADLRLCWPPEPLTQQFSDDLHRWWKQDQSTDGLLHIAAAMSPYVYRAD